MEISKVLDSRVALAVFVSRESVETCRKTFESACRAIPEGGGIDFLVNGNPALARSIGKLVQLSNILILPRVRVWSLPLGDKANAWNIYFHRIWSGEKLVFFIDGYVRLRFDSLQNLQRSLGANIFALAASGVPTIGRSATRLRRQMLIQGGFHGNLCCVKGDVIAELCRRNIRIPLGLYRVDSFLGGILSFGLNPRHNLWDSARIVVDGEASWDVDAKQWWRWTDLKAKLSQVERQLRGKMENEAVKFFFTVLNFQPEQLPMNCRDLIHAWKQADAQGFRRFVLCHPLAAFACRRHFRRDFDWSKMEEVYLLTQMITPKNEQG